MAHNDDTVLVASAEFVFSRGWTLLAGGGPLSVSAEND
jgi:hypothetical protein